MEQPWKKKSMFASLLVFSSLPPPRSWFKLQKLANGDNESQAQVGGCCDAPRASLAHVSGKEG